MISNYLPVTDVEHAPPIIQQLRDAFDDRLDELHASAMRLQEMQREDPTHIVHVPFRYGHFHVEAIYDGGNDLFTQLVARPFADRGKERPSYTISLFLVGRT